MMGGTLDGTLETHWTPIFCGDGQSGLQKVGVQSFLHLGVLDEAYIFPF
jgi:hypothetical protein